jgi:signal transduction histidine kinase
MLQRVLCIESDAPTRELVRRLLEASGFAVEEAATGLAGIGHALSMPPDLVLAGTRLPDLSGGELAARLKQEQGLAHVPFVALGTVGAEHDVAIAAGCDGFIVRPVDPSRFVDEVMAYLGDRREEIPAEGERAGLRALSASLATRLETAVAGANRARERVAELDRMSAAFMHDLAHEVSTPLTPLAGYLKILQSDRLGPLTPEQRRVLDAMASATTKLTRIVDNLSDFASLHAGEAVIVPAPVDPDQLAEDVVSELRVAVKDARLHIEVRPSRAGPVQADPRKLRQALANVVSNAVKFSPHGGEVLIEVTREGGRLRYAVYDQGPGVRVVDAERIFEPFYHANRVEDARPPGSGLGLPVARRIAEAHGGRAFVESPPHTQPSIGAHHYTGSKFVLEITAAPAVAVPAPPTQISG